MRIAVLGGGPGGLLAALLAKRGDPAREVTVFERNRAGDTFGFGVVFSEATLDGIDAALAVYEAERHGQVARIQDAARPSLSWCEHFSRSLPTSKLRQRDAAFVESVYRAWSAAHGGAADPQGWPGGRRGSEVQVAGTPGDHGRVARHEDGQAGQEGAPRHARREERGDIIAVPAWTGFSLTAAGQPDLFTFSDAPVFEKLNLLRTEVT